ncbi:Replication factor C small subunit [Candidatus Nanohalococcus occultus]|uniref:Replication factor C small subunit n=2 Tax=Candidatus Nanohalococcus occultus TaxID=2978047 RepID=A0ABY8CF77_9ARCH|nr:Replication factor C small subunit [Candidatus Nanohaloarchaeota archaeon SVXNc]
MVKYEIHESNQFPDRRTDNGESKMIDVWTEKHRPDTLDEVVGQEKIVERLKSFVEQDSIPHLMFTGPAGTGKTTSAIALAKDLYGDSWKQNFMETNASDDRGINVVREKIKNFARTKPVNADYKIIFLDEADNLTSDAQQALRRTMEQFSENCRFILSCNYSSKIIDPIQSRCAVFRFNRLTDEQVKQYIDRVADSEGFEISDDAKDAVLRVSEGDLRRVTNVLQTTSLNTGDIEEQDVYSASAALKPEEITKIMENALAGKFMDAREELSELMIDRGLDGQDVIASVHRELFDLDIDDRKKLELVDSLAEYEFRIAEGGTDDIQIEALLAKLADLGTR